MLTFEDIVEEIMAMPVEQMDILSDIIVNRMRDLRREQIAQAAR